MLGDVLQNGNRQSPCLQSDVGPCKDRRLLRVSFLQFLVFLQLINFRLVQLHGCFPYGPQRVECLAWLVESMLGLILLTFSLTIAFWLTRIEPVVQSVRFLPMHF